MERVSNDIAIVRLRSVLTEEGVRPAIAFLNGLTGHRYTSVFLFDGQSGRHTYYYDRDDPQQLQAPDILVHLSYCIYVKETAAPFCVADSLTDDRVAPEHPKKAEIRSYCGIPLLDESGNVIGSACHYDSHPVETDERDVELLEMFGTLLARQAAR